MVAGTAVFATAVPVGGCCVGGKGVRMAVAVGDKVCVGNGRSDLSGCGAVTQPIIKIRIKDKKVILK